MALRLLAAGSLITCAHAFSLAAIVWRGLPGRRFAIDPTPQALKLSSAIPSGSLPFAYFSADPDGTIRWHRADSDRKELCVEASGKPDGNVFVNICTNIPAQRWNFVPWLDGKYQIQLRGTNQCFDAVNTLGGVSGAPVALRECSKKTTEMWSFEGFIAMSEQPPSKRYEIGGSDTKVRPHLMSSLIALAAFGSSSLIAMLWWWQKKTRTVNTVPMCQGGASRNVTQSGVCLSANMMIPASMPLSPMGKHPVSLFHTQAFVPPAMAAGPDAASLQELWASAYEGWLNPPGSPAAGAVYLVPVEQGATGSGGGEEPWVEATLKLADDYGGVFGITAFNPAGQDQPMEENLAKNELLKADVQALCAETGGSSQYWNSFGFAADWHEKGFTVAAPQDKVVELAKKYGQGAIYKFYRAPRGAGVPLMRATVPALLPDTEADVACAPCARPGIERADPEWRPAAC